jgi:hypothetical protein
MIRTDSIVAFKEMRKAQEEWPPKLQRIHLEHTQKLRR